MGKWRLLAEDWTDKSQELIFLLQLFLKQVIGWESICLQRRQFFIKKWATRVFMAYSLWKILFASYLD